MLPAVLKPPRKYFSSITAKYLTYKPAYIIMDEISEKYGPITNLQFGINHASKLITITVTFKKPIQEDILANLIFIFVTSNCKQCRICQERL